MERRLEELSRHPFDVAVIGGGILGACVAWDASLRGLSVALVEREDFACATSSNNLKLIHGGLRQLQNLDLAGMRASAMERAAWLRIAPHLVEPVPTLVPVFQRWGTRALYRLALAANDLVTSDANRDLPEDRRIPPGQALSRSECVSRVPELASTSVSGGVLYHDARMYSPERLVLEVVRAATRAGAVAANGVECLGPLTERGERVGVRARVVTSGEELPVRARVLVNAAGPWAGELFERVRGRAEAEPPSLSLAWNLVVRGMGHRTAFALEGGAPSPTAKGRERPRRLVFLPWRGRTLVGTGHAPFDGDPESVREIGKSNPVVQGFLEEVNGAWPGPELSPDDVILTHMGLLPAHRTRPGQAHGRVRLRRRHTLTTEVSGGVPILTARTVKFTMARQVAEVVVDRAGEVLGHRGVSSRTAETPLPGAPEDGMARLRQEAEGELDGLLPQDVIHHLVRSHGTGYRDVVAWRNEDPCWDHRVVPEAPVIRAQLIHGIRREMAQNADDLLFRRCELGATGMVDGVAREQAAEIVDRQTSARRGKPW